MISLEFDRPYLLRSPQVAFLQHFDAYSSSTLEIYGLQVFEGGEEEKAGKGAQTLAAYGRWEQIQTAKEKAYHVETEQNKKNQILITACQRVYVIS